jgi:hypothetical protein
MFIRLEDPDILPRDCPSHEDASLGKDVPSRSISLRIKETLARRLVRMQTNGGVWRICLYRGREVVEVTFFFLRVTGVEERLLGLEGLDRVMVWGCEFLLAGYAGPYD